jgi:cell wall-associated NlpC family hydrolase
MRAAEGARSGGCGIGGGIRRFKRAARRHRTGLMTLAVAYAVTMCTLWPRLVKAEENKNHPHAHARAHAHSQSASASASAAAAAAEARNNVTACRRLQHWQHDEKGPGVALVQAAEHFLGCPYRPGGASSDGFDCSGLVWYVHQLLRMPIPRRAEDQSMYAMVVSEEQLQPGDLLFFHFTDKPVHGSYVDFHYSEINHVGIYLGNGRFIHAPSSGKVVSTARMEDFKRYFVKAGRYWSGSGMLARE